MSEQIHPVVLAEQLGKRFITSVGVCSAIEDLSLCVRAGELTAIVGADGAGKTTLMRLLAGLLMPDSGTLQVLGMDVCKKTQAIQSRISYMPQRFGLYEDLSVQENLDLYADLHGVPQSVRCERFARMLEMTDLARFVHRPAGKLSGGMKQKLGLACTLVRSPDLLLLDEPSVGVDPLSRRDVWRIVQQWVESEGLSVIVSTAYMDEAARCAHVLMLHQGCLLAEGTPTALARHAAGLTLSASVPQGTPVRNLQARLLDAKEWVIDARLKGGVVHLVHLPHVSAQVLTQRFAETVFVPRAPTLEDAFMCLLHRQSAAASPVLAPVIATRSTDQISTTYPAIRVNKLVRRFGDFTAVASTSFEVARGEIFGLLGPNGAGKTTTFRMLCGLLQASSGELEVAGVNLRNAPAQARARIGYVAQKFSLYGNLSVRENLAFFGAAYGVFGTRLAKRIDRLLSQFDLDPNGISAQLPVGYKQRLAMAVALLHEPEILFLDEPTSGIDPLARRHFWRTLSALAQSGVTVIITTHFMEEAEYCDRIAIQDAGVLLALGTPHEVRRQGNADDMENAFIGIVEKARAAGQQAAA